MPSRHFFLVTVRMIFLMNLQKSLCLIHGYPYCGHLTYYSLSRVPGEDPLVPLMLPPDTQVLQVKYQSQREKIQTGVGEVLGQC